MIALPAVIMQTSYLVVPAMTLLLAALGAMSLLGILQMPMAVMTQLLISVQVLM